LTNLKYQNILKMVLLSEVMTMGEENGDACCCLPEGEGTSCFRVESVISVDDRGQMVLPKEIRDRAGIAAGEKLAAISWEKDGRVCCISLIKARDLTEMVSGLLGPMMEEIVGR
jgi:AbrB family looped-hinge helix DNA binding protein